MKFLVHGYVYLRISHSVFCRLVASIKIGLLITVTGKLILMGWIEICHPYYVDGEGVIDFLF